MRFQNAFRLAVVAFLAIPATHLMAQVIAPIGLAAGSQYQLIFTTSGSMHATSTDIVTYNNFVNSQAALSTSTVVQDATWKAIASTASNDAYLNAVSDGTYPVYNTRGQLVSPAGEGIYNIFNLQFPPAFDQDGNAVGATFAWTGSLADGLGASVANGYSQDALLGDGLAELGEANITTYTGTAPFATNFIERNAVANTTNFSFPFYAISSPLTQTPEPSSIILMGTGLLAVGGIHFLRRRREAR